MTEERQYEIQCKVRNRVKVIVTAKSADEAKHKFDMGKWDPDSLDFGEVIDWHPCSEPKEVK